MSRFNLCLLIVLLFCALSVIHATYRQRHFFVELERSRARMHQFQQETAQLQYQQGVLSKTARIRVLATRQLNMLPVSAVLTQYLFDTLGDGVLENSKLGSSE